MKKTMLKTNLKKLSLIFVISIVGLFASNKARSEGVDNRIRTLIYGENDIYVITTAEDRYDRLARQYYNDVSLWWVISAANEDLPQNTLFPTEGTQLRIPTNVNEILNNYNRLNQ